MVILNCEDELLTLVNLLDIRDFLMASSENDSDCELDVALVEGAVLSRQDEEKLKKIRERSKTLVAMGTCAVWGGVAAMDRGVDRMKLVEQVYGAMGRSYDSRPARALHEVVKVDLSLTGCPIEKAEFLSAAAHLLNGNPPLFVPYTVCAECKTRENNCLLTESGEACRGPLTAAGCNARCPELRVACVGCRGPAEDINIGAALATYAEKGTGPEEVARKLGTFAPSGAWGEV